MNALVMEHQPPELPKSDSSTASSPFVYRGYFEQERFSPPIVALSALFALFFLYQIGGAILTILFTGARSSDITEWNSSAMRLSQSLAQLLFLALPTLLLVSLHTGRSPLSAINLDFLGLRRPPSLMASVSGSLAIIVMTPFLSYVGDVQLVIMNDVFGWREVISQMQAQYKTLLEKLTVVHSPAEFVGVVLTVAFVPALCEECLFRGYVQHNFLRAMPTARAIVLTGIIFGLYHINPVQIVPLMILGVYLSYLRASSGTLLLPMLAHFANNFFSVLGLMAVRQKEALGLSDDVVRRLQSDEPDISSPVAIVAMLISASLTLALLALYRRSLNRASTG
ncbi:MAG: type II CAAX prenyl endopeptidase Rce1 family protein [Candidatus Thermochlorobacter sp.]